jgi:plasmid stabilization system protein ParE
VTAELTEAAERDLREIVHYIGVKDGRPQLAVQILDELLNCCDQLAELSSFSQIGTLARELGRGVRLYPYKRWVIIFRYVDDGALILRIADGSQDYLSLKVQG